MVSGRRRRVSVKRRIFLLVLLFLLPLMVLGTVLAHILLVPLTAAGSYDDLRTHLHREIAALMQTHGVPGVALALAHDVKFG